MKNFFFYFFCQNISLLVIMFQDKGPDNTLSYIMREVSTKFSPGVTKYHLPDIGQVIEMLMGYGYQSPYTGPEFKQIYSDLRKRNADVSYASG